MAQASETRYTGASAAVTRLPNGGTRWVLDETGPIRHTSFIQYLVNSRRSFALIREDGLHIHNGIVDEPVPEPAQPDRPPTSYMHQREGRWYFNDAAEEDDDDIFGPVSAPMR